MPKRTRPARRLHPIFEECSLLDLVKLSNNGYSYYTLRDVRSGATVATKRFMQYWSGTVHRPIEELFNTNPEQSEEEQS